MEDTLKDFHNQFYIAVFSCFKGADPQNFPNTTRICARGVAFFSV